MMVLILKVFIGDTKALIFVLWFRVKDILGTTLRPLKIYATFFFKLVV